MEHNNRGNNKELQILIIDDDQNTREVMEEVLKIEGYKTRSAADGTSGYSSALASHPDLILLDLNLPDMHGKQVIDMIRKREELQKVPILVLTGESREEAQHAVNVGANAFLLKPVEFNALLESIPQVRGKG